jgi:hypothetical protein
MTNFINFHVTSQPKSSPEVVRLVLHSSCDKLDLIGLYHIGKAGEAGAEVPGLMTTWNLSNPATNVRLRKLSGDTKVKGLPVPLLLRDKTGFKGSHKYFLNHELVTLKDIAAVMVSKGISYDQYISESQNKRFEVHRVEATEDNIGNNRVNEDRDFPKQSNGNEVNPTENSLKENYEGCNQQVAKNEATVQDEVDSLLNDLKQANPEEVTEPVKAVHQTNLLRSVTLGEVIQIVEAATEVVVDEFEKQLTERDARIAELEKQLALFKELQVTNNNYTEEVLHTVRSTVLSKFGERSSRQNGKTPY